MSAPCQNPSCLVSVFPALLPAINTNATERLPLLLQCEAWSPSQGQLRFLVSWAFTDLEESATRQAAFHLLKVGGAGWRMGYCVGGRVGCCAGGRVGDVSETRAPGPNSRGCCTPAPETDVGAARPSWHAHVTLTPLPHLPDWLASWCCPRCTT